MPSADRMESTLAPTPSFNKNVPVVTPAGGTEAAYKDPNSPESILRNTASLQAQVAVDQKYDVATSPYYEPFSDYNNSSVIQILLSLIVLIFIMLVSLKNMSFAGRIFLLTIASILMIFLIHVYI